MMILGLALVFWTAHIEVAYGKSCPNLYARYSSTHTFCKDLNPSCVISHGGITDTEKLEIVFTHNMFREIIASGTDNFLKRTAADMLEMVWNDELASVAQAHANQCIFQHDCYPCRKTVHFDVGQNIYELHSSSGEFRNKDWPHVIGTWYNELQDFNPNGINYFQSQQGPQIGHFTQVIWAKSWAIGCGYVEHNEGGGDKQLYVCNYGPEGNVKTQVIYKEGPPASQCPQNTCPGGCGNQGGFPSLCQIPAGLHPFYGPKPGRDILFFCDFDQPGTCYAYTPQNEPQWELYSSLSGSFKGIILTGGQSTSLYFDYIIPAYGQICIDLIYRKGSNVALQQTNNVAQMTFDYVDQIKRKTHTLPRNSADFFQFYLNTNLNTKIRVGLTFSVPPGAVAQYMEVKRLEITGGTC